MTDHAARWHELCHEYDRLIDRMARTNKRLFAWLVFCWLLAVMWMGIALWALTK